MKRRQSLKGREPFREVLKRGTRYRGKSVFIIILKEEEFSYYCSEKPVPEKAGARIGIGASKKIGGAHIRNRAKRRIRHAVDELLTEIKGQHCIIMYPTVKTIESRFEDIKKEISGLFGKAGIK